MTDRHVGTITVSLLGGPYDGRRGEITATPARIVIGGRHEYHAVTDPDSGVFLGGYAYAGPA